MGMPTRKLGSQGLQVPAIGLGCMSMSQPDKLQQEEMIQLLHSAIDSGVTFLDTSDVYGSNANELLIGQTLKRDVRPNVKLATKFGISAENGTYEIYGNAMYVRAACEANLKPIEIDCIDLYYQHRSDTRVPIEITIFSTLFI